MLNIFRETLKQHIEEMQQTKYATDIGEKNSNLNLDSQ